MQINLLHPHALIAYRFDARDIVHEGGELALVERQNSVLNVLGTHAVVSPHDGGHRNVDLGEDIDRHAQRRTDPHEGDQNQDGDYRVWSLQGGFDDRHVRTSISVFSI